MATEIMGVRADAGSRAFGHLDVTTLATGEKLRVGLHVVAGTKPGPTLLVGAATHGDELASILIVNDLLKRLDPTTLSGTVAAVPVMNPLAFETQTPFTYQDAWDLDESFPAATSGTAFLARGWVTQQMAGALADLVRAASAVIAVHSGVHGTAENYVRAGVTDDAAYDAEVLALARALGLQAVVQRAPATNSLLDYAARAHIPALEVHVGGGLPLDRSVTENALTGLTNVLRQMKMLPGAETRAQQQLLFSATSMLRTKSGGMFYSEVAPRALNSTVSRGTVLGRIVHSQTLKELEIITAPFEETYLLMLRGAYGKVHPGELAFVVADRQSGRDIN